MSSASHPPARLLQHVPSSSSSVIHTNDAMIYPSIGIPGKYFDLGIHVRFSG